MGRCQDGKYGQDMGEGFGSESRGWTAGGWGKGSGKLKQRPVAGREEGGGKKTLVVVDSDGAGDDHGEERAQCDDAHADLDVLQPCASDTTTESREVIQPDVAQYESRSVQRNRLPSHNLSIVAPEQLRRKLSQHCAPAVGPWLVTAL